MLTVVQITSDDAILVDGVIVQIGQRIGSDTWIIAGIFDTESGEFRDASPMSLMIRREQFDVIELGNDDPDDIPFIPENRVWR